ncbi:phage tail tube protein [Acinetobacter baumannii]|uniref:phage tail tube protein n=1 Tax=Acinetobacter baumannii TaxID=470 RepID=UPI00214D575D|nr:phage tail tube protein [Acinetobacter baumannii]MCR4047211.1 phage tail tube protein [Acinetobacter baumannii]MCR4055911.1 phage tail tube protein [Acinetobacter baumannii]MDP7749724.1 phage tail tube protein [Acinetobacter baumannii]MDP7866182.1 phage tail tube protein [Acinetobacter baumannii]MDP7873625.1 phage tail tube protein [Acinetobacter baumannii]
MSSGAKIRLYACEEAVLGTTPANPVWYTVRRVTDSLTENVTTEDSSEVVDSRFRQGAVVTEAEVTGQLEFELSLGTFDLFLNVLAFNNWAANALSFGGGVRKSLTLVKVFEDIGQVFIYRGIQVNTGEMTIQTTGKITGNFGLVGSSFTRQQVNPVTNPIPASTRPLVSMPNVEKLLINGQSIQGKACLQTLTINFSNNLEAIRCIGSGKYTPEFYLEKMMDIGVNANFMFSATSASWIDAIKTRDVFTLTFDITDTKGSKYLFNFPQLEVKEANHPDGGGDDIITIDINFAQVRTSPTIVRALV